MRNLGKGDVYSKFDLKPERDKVSRIKPQSDGGSSAQKPSSGATKPAIKTRPQIAQKKVKVDCHRLLLPEAKSCSPNAKYSDSPVGREFPHGVGDSGH